jgi:hypothetical protein
MKYLIFRLWLLSGALFLGELQVGETFTAAGSLLAPGCRAPAERIFQAALTSWSSIRLNPIKKELRTFVGLAFEQLVQQWLATGPEVLPFRPEAIGSHWQRKAQVDVAAVSWQTTELLPGECQ